MPEYNRCKLMLRVCGVCKVTHMNGTGKICFARVMSKCALRLSNTKNPSTLWCSSPPSYVPILAVFAPVWSSLASSI